MATFLLVHGAFQGGWVWTKVAPLLCRQGHIVHAPTLSGCGYLSRGMRPEEDLNVYINDIINYLDMEELDEVILVAHSFSGLICGALMMLRPHRIRQAIFVDALIPESQSSFVDIAGQSFRQMLDHHRMEGGQVKPWPVKVFGVVGSEADWFASRLRPFSYQAFHTSFPGHFDPTAVATSYISCTQTMSPFIQEMAVKAKGFLWPIYELDTGHCPMITCPEDLVLAMETAV
ncbi:MAG: alpha/beta fold hydrolase [Desulfobulbaceae bacterium]|nr:alpha/beta fold hydrolase [Desulfobulbaceae bacterium]